MPAWEFQPVTLQLTSLASRQLLPLNDFNWNQFSSFYYTPFLPSLFLSCKISTWTKLENWNFRVRSTRWFQKKTVWPVPPALFELARLRLTGGNCEFCRCTSCMKRMSEKASHLPQLPLSVTGETHSLIG